MIIFISIPFEDGFFSTTQEIDMLPEVCLHSPKTKQNQYKNQNQNQNQTKPNQTKTKQNQQPKQNNQSKKNPKKLTSFYSRLKKPKQQIPQHQHIDNIQKKSSQKKFWETHSHNRHLSTHLHRIHKDSPTSKTPTIFHFLNM